MKTTLRRLAVVGATTAMIAGGVATPASAEPWSMTFEGATAGCSFPLVVSGPGEATAHNRQFYDQEGNLVRGLLAGTGDQMTFTNRDTGATFSTPSNGAVQRSMYQADGSSTGVLTGHNVLILYPSDVGGPSTTLYIGQVATTVDALGVTEVVKESGLSIDICAVLTQD